MHLSFHLEQTRPKKLLSLEEMASEQILLSAQQKPDKSYGCYSAKPLRLYMEKVVGKINIEFILVVNITIILR